MSHFSNVRMKNDIHKYLVCVNQLSGRVSLNINYIYEEQCVVKDKWRKKLIVYVCKTRGLLNVCQPFMAVSYTHLDVYKR